MQTPTFNTVEAVASRYPPNSAGFNDFFTDLEFACHAQMLAKTFKENAYRYVMSIPPATHELDQSYYFYIDNVTTPGDVDVQLARRFQAYLRDFVLWGDQDGQKDGNIRDGMWPEYDEGTIFNITKDGFEVAVDPWSKGGRCDFLQSIVDNPANGF
jgi:carboxylesterase type B